MSSNSDDDVTNLCKICNQNETKYCCPRCNILYCSLSCYISQLHSQCSESFYRDCFMEEMASADGDPTSKKKMMEILSNMHNTAEEGENNLEEMFSDTFENPDGIQDSDDDDSIPDLEVRLKDIDLNDCDLIWENLTEEEKREFEALLEEDIAKIVPLWEPWWLYFMKKPLCEIINSSNTKPSYDYKTKCPSIVNIGTKFSDVSKNTPAACVKYNLINVISSYVYMARFFNGDHIDHCNEAISCLLLSNNLKNGTNYEDLEASIKSVIQESYNTDSIAANSEMECQITNDIKCIIRGPNESNQIHYMLSALSDIHTFLNKYKNDNSNALNSSKTNKEFSKKFNVNINCVQLPKNKIKMLIKKIEYYIMYVNEHGHNLFGLIM